MNKISHTCTLIALILFVCLPAAAQYNYENLSAGFSSLKNEDESDVALKLIKNNLIDFYPAEITSALKKSYPALPADKTIRVIPFVRENMIENGSSFQRAAKISDNLLRFMDLRQRIRFIYFKSEIPVTGFTYPFALFVSDSAANILTDDELEAVMAHEIVHLIVYQVFKEAVDEKDLKKQRAVELFCDGGAISILEAKGKNPADLVNGLKKMEKLLQKVDEDAVQGVVHPTIKSREKFFKKLTEKITLAKNQALSN